MTKPKTTNMADMFEQAKREVIAKYNSDISSLQRQIDSLESCANKYDCGLGDIEDRNEINYLQHQIISLEKQRDAELAALTIQEKTK